MVYAVGRSLRYVVVLGVLAIVVVPFLWIFLASFRPNSDLITRNVTNATPKGAL